MGLNLYEGIILNYYFKNEHTKSLYMYHKSNKREKKPYIIKTGMQRLFRNL